MLAKNAVIPPKAELPYLLTSRASNFPGLNQPLDTMDGHYLRRQVCLEINQKPHFAIEINQLPLSQTIQSRSMNQSTIFKVVGIILFSGYVSAQQPAVVQPKTEKAKLSTAKKDDRPSPPQEVKAVVGDLSISIAYSSPGVKNRKIWGELVPYNKVWRTGANEATTIEVSRDCKVGGSVLKAGKYSLFSIPGENEWTIIFNSVPDQWGAYKYDAAKDALRIKAIPTESAEFNERLKFEIMQEGKASLSWEKLMVSWEMR